MQEDVRLELAEKEERERARIAAADRSGVHRASEVPAHHREHAPRRRLLGVRIERNDERSLPRGQMHLHGDGRAEDHADERNELLREAAEDDARISRCVGAREVLDERRHGDVPRAHRGVEQFLLRWEVAEDGRGRDGEIGGDVGKRGGGKPAVGERESRAVEDLRAADARRTAHR